MEKVATLASHTKSDGDRGARSEAGRSTRRMCFSCTCATWNSRCAARAKKLGDNNRITRLVREEEECEGARRRAQQERRTARAAHQQAARRE